MVHTCSINNPKKFNNPKLGRVEPQKSSPFLLFGYFLPFPPSTHTSRLSINDMATALDNVLNVWNRTRQNSPIYNFLLEDVEIYEASKGVVRARLQVTARQLNSKRGLHGAFSACVVDWAGGLAIASHGFESTGVSTDIHVSYISKASLGDWLEIESRTDRVGKTLGFTSVTISKRGEDGQLSVVAQGSHTKYIITS
jgi:acyl-coenzyme A thioesterase 13